MLYRPRTLLVIAGGVCLALGACSYERDRSAPPAANATGASAANAGARAATPADPGAQVPPRVEGQPASAVAGATPTAGATTGASAAPHSPAADHGAHAALPNLHQIAPGVYSGGQPVGDAGFDALRALGIRTVISVDGAEPDVPRAEARAMRYAHVPVTYATITPEQTAQVARALRDLPGPIYIHCHHGRHRGPAAIAGAMVALGRMTPEQATAWMRTAGTSEHYRGLFECVAAGEELSQAALDATEVPPPVARVKSMTAMMAAVDLHMEHLESIKRAGWATPADSPDLVPAAEASIVHNHLRTLLESEEITREPEEFARLLVANVQAADELQLALERGERDRAALDAMLVRLARTCKDCHVKFRDY